MSLALEKERLRIVTISTLRMMELERQLSSEEHSQLSKGTWGLIPNTHMLAHKPSVTTVPGAPRPPSGLGTHQASMWCISIHVGEVFTYIK